MSDFNSSLPIRTENNGDVVAKIADATTPSQQMAVTATGHVLTDLHDGTGTAITSTGGSLDVNITGGSSSGAVADQSTFTYGSSSQTPVGGVFQDTSPTLTAGQTGAVRLTSQRGMHTNLRSSAGAELLGQTTMSASIPVAIASDQTAVPVSNLPTTVDTNFGTVGASTIRSAAQIGNATGAADFNAGATGAQTLRTEANQGASATAANGWYVKPTDGTNSQAYTAGGEAEVSVTQPLPAGTNNIGLVSIRDSAGAAFSATNPLYVTEINQGGVSVNDYNTVASVAAGASSNHDYTVTAAKTLYLAQIWAAASGKLKIQVQIETGVATGVFNTIYVGFNSTANPNIRIPIPADRAVAAGVRVRVIRTNNDNQAQDVYSTITGSEY
jgi:hypothetical protein